MLLHSNPGKPETTNLSQITKYKNQISNKFQIQNLKQHKNQLLSAIIYIFNYLR